MERLRVVWLVLVLTELVYVAISTWASIRFHFQPMVGEIVRCLARTLSLVVCIVLGRFIAIPQRQDLRRFGTQLPFLAGAIVLMLLFPLLLQKQNFTGLLQALWFSSSFLVGFREEFFYRRLVQSSMEKKIGLSLGILVTSVIFAFYHVYFFVYGSWAGFAQVFLWSVTIGLIWYITRNFILIALVHGVYDAIPYATPVRLPFAYSWGLALLTGAVILVVTAALRLWKQSNPTPRST